MVDCALLCGACFGYLHYVISVINEICAYLDITCLTLTKKMKKS